MKPRHKGRQHRKEEEIVRRKAQPRAILRRPRVRLEEEEGTVLERIVT